MGGSDYVKLRAFDVDGESFELNIFADGLRNFEALADAINEAQADARNDVRAERVREDV